jgi:hypothetical protein
MWGRMSKKEEGVDIPVQAGEANGAVLLFFP